jgi:hypothetical protein
MVGGECLHESGSRKRASVEGLAVLFLILFGPAVMAQASRGTAPDYGVPQVRMVNEQLQQLWSERGIRPAGPATDDEWCRRLFLDAIGRIPSVDELRSFRADRSPQKRRRLVDELLESERYRTEFARNWSTIWTNLLIGRSGAGSAMALPVGRGCKITYSNHSRGASHTTASFTSC